jgi:hypothetical protein
MSTCHRYGFCAGFLGVQQKPQNNLYNAIFQVLSSIQLIVDQMLVWLSSCKWENCSKFFTEHPGILLGTLGAAGLMVYAKNSQQPPKNEFLMFFSSEKTTSTLTDTPCVLWASGPWTHIHLPSYLPTLSFSHDMDPSDPRKLQAAVSYIRKCPKLAHALLYFWSMLLFICTNFYSLDCRGEPHEYRSRGNNLKGWISYLWSCHMIA